MTDLQSPSDLLDVEPEQVQVSILLFATLGTPIGRYNFLASLSF